MKKFQNDYEALLKRRDDANTLISGLTGEKIRWNEQNLVFEKNIEKFFFLPEKTFSVEIFFHFSFRLIGNAVLATAFLTYSGPFNQEFRQRIFNDCQKQVQQRSIPFSENFNIIEQLSDEATVFHR